MADSSRVIERLQADLAAGRLHHAYCVVGAGLDTAAVADALGVALVDRFQLLEVNIAAMRQFISQAALRPLTSPFRLGIIDNAADLLPEAEQAFLKTLEEPAKNTRFLLTTPRLDLLPTTLSRLRVIYNQANETETTDTKHYWQALQQPPLSAAFQAAAELAGRDDYRQLLQQMLEVARQETVLRPQVLTALLHAWRAAGSTASKRLQAEQLAVILQTHHDYA